MRELARATIFRTGPMDVEQAISEIIETREVINPQDVVIAAGKISFPTEDGISVEHSNGTTEYIEFQESGSKSICSLLGFPYHLLRKLSPETRSSMFSDLFRSKFNGTKNFIKLRCSSVGTRRLRAIFANRQRVFNDRDVFASISNAAVNFDVACYWTDDYVSAIRFRCKVPVHTWDSREIRIGFDVVNSEVRERSLEVRGVMWVGDSALIAPKLVYPMYRGKNSKVNDIRNLAPTVEAMCESVMRGAFTSNIKVALDDISYDKVALGREIKSFYDREIFTSLDVIKFMQMFKKKKDKRWTGKDAYSLCDMEKNTRVSKLQLIDGVAAFANEFDTYMKRSTLEFGLNLLF